MKDKIFFLYATKFGKTKFSKALEILYPIYGIMFICKLICTMFYTIMCLCSFLKSYEQSEVKKSTKPSYAFQLS